MIEVIDNEKKVIYYPDYSDHPKRKKHIVVIPHLRCCNQNMIEQAAYINNYKDKYMLKDEDNLSLVKVEEKCPQYFECSICKKIMIRRYFKTYIFIKAYQHKNPFIFTAITDDITKKLTLERFMEILLDSLNYDTKNNRSK